MEEQKLNITLPEGYTGGPVEVIVREGEASEIDNNLPVGFSKHVTVKSINAFVQGRAWMPTPKENTGVVIFCINPDRPALDFDANPNDRKATKLTSKLKVNPDLLAFQINQDRFFSQKELEKLVRKYSHCFADSKDPQALRQALLNFEVKFEQHVKAADDRKGNTEDYAKTAIKMVAGTIPDQWKLKLPLFVATDAVEITIDIEIEKQSNNMPGFGFYSSDLERKLRDKAEDVILTEVGNLSSTFVCLEVE